MDKTKNGTSARTAGTGRGSGAPVLILLDRRRREPLFRQIYGSLRQAILSGRLPPGTRLPPSRILAADLGVSRTITVLAYEHLATEGYISGRGSAGSFVASLQIASPRPQPGRRAAPDRPATDPAPRTLALPTTAGGLGRLRSAPTPFRIGEPAVDLFPAQVWTRLYARRARRSAASLMGYGPSAGHHRLRAAIAAYVGAARGVTATAEQVILARGAQQAIDLVGRVLLAPGDAVWVEDPGYLSARALIELAGATTVPVPVDEQGMVVPEGERVAPGARLAYVSPSHQFPLGHTLSLSRRLALLDWARRSGAWVVEDDFDSEFRYTGSPIPSLQGLDTGGRVIYLGTFSKTVFPALRLGYLIVPPSLIEAFRGAQAVFDHMAPSLEQATLADFIEGGHFTRHVRRMRSAYEKRQRHLQQCVAEALPELVEASMTETGMHMVAWLRDRTLDDRLVSRLAWEAGVEVAPLSLYCKEVRLAPGLLLGFAATSPSAMRPAIRTLREAILAASRTPPHDRSRSGSR